MQTAATAGEDAGAVAARGTGWRLISIIPLIVMMGLSLALLGYVGYGETNRAFGQFQVEKLTTQGAMMHSLVQDFVQEGLPLEFIETFASDSGQLGQFAGFTAFKRSGGPEDRYIGSFTLMHPEGDVAFSTDPDIKPEVEFPLPKLAKDFVEEAYDTGEVDPAGLTYMDETADNFRIFKALTDETDPVGFVLVTLPKLVVSDVINREFQLIAWIGLGILAVFAVSAFVLVGRGETAVSLAFAVGYLAMSGVLIYFMVQIYSVGAQTKTRALFDSLNQRLSAVVESGMDINNVSGLLDVFREYTSRNPEIAAVALIVDGISTVNTQPEKVGATWQSNPEHIEYTARFAATDGENKVALSVALPSDVVRDRIARSIKNFAALFVASGFIAFLFLTLTNALRRVRSLGPASGSVGELTDEESDVRLSLIRPVWFLAVFAEGLFTAFLPQYMIEVTNEAGLSPSWSTLPFTAFFFAFVVALIPAGRIAERIDIKRVLTGASLLFLGGLVLLIFTRDFYLLVGARVLGGFAQGAVFIGVQSYILKSVSESRKTRGSAIIVFAFNTGILSGAAIGALLVIFIGPLGVFSVASATAGAMLLFALLVLPNVGRAGRSGERADSLSDLLRGTRDLFADIGFVSSFLFVGIASKAVLTGVAIFALPLVMTQQGYAQEDIGQILMFFAAGVLIANHWSSHLADRLGRTAPMLLIGMMGTGVALIIMGVTKHMAAMAMGFPQMDTVALVGGVLLLGLGQGCINAPIVTHIMQTPGALSVGRQMTTTIYRVMERLGHAVGPLIVGQLLLLNHQDPLTIGYIGGAMLVFGVLFLLGSRRGAPRPA